MEVIYRDIAIIDADASKLLNEHHLPTQLAGMHGIIIAESAATRHRDYSILLCYFPTLDERHVIPYMRRTNGHSMGIVHAKYNARSIFNHPPQQFVI
jgi:hypothetical protein